MAAIDDLLAPRVLLAFDDFARAGTPLLRSVQVEGQRKDPLMFSSSALSKHITGSKYTRDGTADYTLSVITVATAQLDDTALWELADALVQRVSDSEVKHVTVVAALHLPEAKPHSDALENVYRGSVGASSMNASKLKEFDPSWEIKDAFLTRFLHFARVEQAFSTDVVVVKGYKPGRDGVATREAIDTLAEALPSFLAGTISDVAISVDVQTAVLAAYSSLTMHSQPVNLLYQ